MTYHYATDGTCSRQISFEIDDNACIHNIRFVGGCPGNTVGVAALCEGMKASEAYSRLRDIRCGSKQTSCPDQLAKAIHAALNPTNP